MSEVQLAGESLTPQNKISMAILTSQTQIFWVTTYKITEAAYSFTFFEGLSVLTIRIIERISYRCTLKGFVLNKWSFLNGERLQRAWLFVRLSWGNTGGLSSVTGWTWSVTCISVLLLNTEGGVYPWPVCAKEQEKYTFCMFILSAIMLGYWGCVNTWVCEVYSFFNREKKGGLGGYSNMKFIKTTTGILYLHHL